MIVTVAAVYDRRRSQTAATVGHGLQMVMKWLLLILALISVMACHNSAETGQPKGSDPPNGWAGTYAYSGSAGETAGGTPVAVGYRLVLADKAPGEGTLIIRGYQTDETLRCEITGTKDKIEIKFRSYASGKTTNEFGVQQHQPGSVLFTLERVPPGKQEKLLTNWKSLRPDTAKSESGEYFTKISGA
ncbi:MAG TPA: DUF5991 domain-containing protein [Terriglobia bacterium]|nr:DUF5991 domain-containing protein [Terriglobia bacterium]